MYGCLILNCSPEENVSRQLQQCCQSLMEIAANVGGTRRRPDAVANTGQTSPTIGTGAYCKLLFIQDLIFNTKQY